MGKLWLNSGGKLIASGGKLVECAACPCGLPSGLYVVGDFTRCDPAGTNVIANGVAVYDFVGAAWHSLGTGITSPGTSNFIFGCILFNGKLVVYGNFSHIDGVSVSNIAAWDGFAWSAMGTPAGVVNSCCLDGSGNLIASIQLNGQPPQIWNGSTWSNLGTWPRSANTTNVAYTNDGLVAADSGLYSSGSSAYAWNGSTWVGLGSPNLGIGTAWQANRIGAGVGGATTVGYTITFSGSNVPVHAHVVQKYASGTWTSFGRAIDASNETFSPVQTLVTLNNILYVSAQQSQSGGAWSYNWAWDGSSWSNKPGDGGLTINLGYFAYDFYYDGSTYVYYVGNMGASGEKIHRFIPGFVPTTFAGGLNAQGTGVVYVP